MSEEIVKLNEKEIKERIKEPVRGGVEETPVEEARIERYISYVYADGICLRRNRSGALKSNKKTEPSGSVFY